MIKEMVSLRISIVVPAFNEEGNIAGVVKWIDSALVASSIIADYEIILVDDGSTDSTLLEMKVFDHPRFKIIHWEKNRGKTSAIKAGVIEAAYNTIATLDADLQNDPSDIVPMVERILEGADFVQGVRLRRCDPWIKRLSSRIANFFRRFVLGDKFSDINCGLRVFKKECFLELNVFEGAHRFFPTLVQQNGRRVEEHFVKHFPRQSGISKYNTRNRLLLTLTDLIRVKFQR